MHYLLLIIGFILLIKGAVYFVDGSSSLAYKFNIPKIVIGLTIVGFGTSSPELIVNVLSAFNGNTSLAIGNIIGSNTLNILLILGISAIIYPMKAQKPTIINEIPFSLLGIIVIGITANDIFFNNFQNISRLGDKDPSNIIKYTSNSITQGDGLILLSFFIIFMYYIFSLIKSTNDTQEVEVKELSLIKAILFIIIGLAGLIIGGNLIVDSSVIIAKNFKIDETIIGLTIIAIGTSLPELATSAVAAYKKQSDIVIGNIVGSNIFNAFWILGVTAIINPIKLTYMVNLDILICLLAHIFLFVTMFTGKKRTIDRWEGILLVSLYFIYIILRIFYL
ncbi:MAG TPA: calcium/sodium antiporter [Ignavibacteriales bacterium]|nr:calcium/sodium antiporter [Ignavibacteriales bacterium]HOL81942.1 calcium/sodium antiporter [Ignavibacteriales bacterium]HOM65934.1 calcium/sodium antiporter [Ignavibacteriales bacterium]